MAITIYGSSNNFEVFVFVTFGIAVFSIFNIVVMVNTEVIPRAIRAAVASGGIQNDIHDNMTMSAHGA